MLGRILKTVAAPVISTAGQLFGMHKQNQYNVASQEAAYESMKEMAQHQYQWATQDLRKAGLNPILAATGGGIQGASATSRPVASAGLPDMAVGESLTSARQLNEIQKKQVEMAQKRQESEIDQMQSQTALNQATTAFQMAQEQRERELLPFQKLSLEGQAGQFAASINKLNQDTLTSSALQSLHNAQAAKEMLDYGIYRDKKDIYALAKIAQAITSGTNPLLGSAYFTLGGLGDSPLLEDKNSSNNSNATDVKEKSTRLQRWFRNYEDDQRSKRAQRTQHRDRQDHH